MQRTATFLFSKGFILYMAAELVHVKRCFNPFLHWLEAEAVHSLIPQNSAFVAKINKFYHHFRLFRVECNLNSCVCAFKWFSVHCLSFGFLWHDQLILKQSCFKKVPNIQSERFFFQYEPWANYWAILDDYQTWTSSWGVIQLFRSFVGINMSQDFCVVCYAQP